MLFESKREHMDRGDGWFMAFFDIYFSLILPGDLIKIATPIKWHYFYDFKFDETLQYQVIFFFAVKNQDISNEFIVLRVN